MPAYILFYEEVSGVVLNGRESAQLKVSSNSVREHCDLERSVEALNCCVMTSPDEEKRVEVEL